MNMAIDDWRGAASPFQARGDFVYDVTSTETSICTCSCECSDNFVYQAKHSCRTVADYPNARICEPYQSRPAETSKPKPRPQTRASQPRSSSQESLVCCSSGAPEYAVVVDTITCSNDNQPTCQSGVWPDLQDNEGVDAVLDNAYGADFSPDGQYYYVASAGDDSGSVQLDDTITVFSVDAAGDGHLSWVQTIRDSDESIPDDPTKHGLGLRDVRHIKVSPNGAWAYATSTEDQSLAIFQRDPETGILTWHDTFWDQNSEAAAFLDFIDQDRIVEGLDTPWEISFAGENGIYIYVMGAGDHEVGIFGQPDSGVAPHYIGFRKTNRANSGDSAGGCHAVDSSGNSQFLGIWNPIHVSVSPTNDFLVISGSTSDNFGVFAIDIETGGLTCAEVVDYFGGSDIMVFQNPPDDERDSSSTYDELFIYSLTNSEDDPSLAVFEVRSTAKFLSDYSDEDEVNDDDDGCTAEDCGGNAYRKIELIQVLDGNDVEPLQRQALSLDISAVGCSAYVSLYSGGQFVAFQRDSNGYLDFAYTSSSCEREASQSFSVLHHPWANFVYQTSMGKSANFRLLLSQPCFL
jgi:hypothetical protein